MGGVGLRASMLTECPHCFSDVLVKSDGSCPACLADVLNAFAIGANLGKISLRDGTTQLPTICAICGHETSRTISFVRRAPNGNFSSNPMTGGGVVGVVLTWVLDRISGKSQYEIAIRVPLCQQCSASKRELRVKHLDFENGIATLVVHKQFKEALSSAGATRNA